MVIEHFRPGRVKELYKRFEEKGRMTPEGVNYISSWIDEDVKTCYQIMECSSENKLKEWIDKWEDLVEFEVVPVITSAEAKAKVFAN